MHAGIVRGFHGQRAVIPGYTDHFVICGVRSVDGIFGSVEIGAGAVGDLSLDPFAFQNHDRFRRFRVAVGRNDRTRGKTAQKKPGARGGIMGKSGELHARVRSRFPEGGIWQADGREHAKTMPEGILSDNRQSG